MNERMEDLMYRAGLTAQGCWDEMDSYDRQAIEKFAELIVRECCEVAKQTDADDGDDYKSGRTWAGIEILKHFNVGVEE